jgi:hypothetical protein
MKRRTFYIIVSLVMMIVVFLLFRYGYFFKYNRYSAFRDIKKGNIQIVLFAGLHGSISSERVYSDHDVKVQKIKPTNYNWRGIYIYNEIMSKELKKKDSTNYLKLKEDLHLLGEGELFDSVGFSIPPTGLFPDRDE